MEDVGVFYSHLVKVNTYVAIWYTYFMVIWYIFYIIEMLYQQNSGNPQFRPHKTCAHN
jgi:hypothetical protein